MPQMNPMWWFSLFIYFIIILIFMNTLIYFFSFKTTSKNIYKIIKTKTTWMW